MLSLFGSAWVVASRHDLTHRAFVLLLFVSPFSRRKVARRNASSSIVLGLFVSFHSRYLRRRHDASSTVVLLLFMSSLSRRLWARSDASSTVVPALVEDIRALALRELLPPVGTT